MAVRSPHDAGGDAAQEPARAEQGRARPGARARQDGAAGEEAHQRHQEARQGGPDGKLGLTHTCNYPPLPHLLSSPDTAQLWKLPQSIAYFNAHFFFRLKSEQFDLYLI